jgi:hypothetical protein
MVDVLLTQLGDVRAGPEDELIMRKPRDYARGGPDRCDVSAVGRRVRQRSGERQPARRPDERVMSPEPQSPEAPDLTAGIPMNSLAEGVPVRGHFEGGGVILVRRGADICAIGAT